MTIRGRITELQEKVDVLKLANQQKKEADKLANVKYEPVHAPSVIYKMERDIDALVLMDYAGLEAMIEQEEDLVQKKEYAMLLKRFIDPATSQVIEVKEGDLVTDLLLNRYRDVKNIATKLDMACEKKGLKVDLAKNKIVKK